MYTPLNIRVQSTLDIVCTRYSEPLDIVNIFDETDSVIWIDM